MTNRYNFAKAQWSEKLFAWSRQDKIGRNMGDDVESVFERFAFYDPTRNASSCYKFLSWLCRVAVKENIPPTKLTALYEYLQAFMASQDRIPLDKRDINRIQTSTGLETIILHYCCGGTSSLSQLRGAERERVMKETEFLYDSPELRILIPKTREASQFWGRGTKWCVSGKDEKSLYHYNDFSGPVVVYILNEKITDTETGITYQVKFGGHFKSPHLKDARDKVTTEIPLVLQNYLLSLDDLDFYFRHGSIKPIHFPPNTFNEEALLEQIKAYRILLSQIHEAERTEAVCLACVLKTPADLMSVPEEHFTAELCLQAVQKSGSAIQYIPPAKFGLDAYMQMCFEAVQQDAMALGYVHPCAQVEALFCAALRKDYKALELIAERDRTAEVYKAYIDNDPQNGFYRIDKLIQDQPFYLEVKQYALEHSLQKKEKAQQLLRPSP